MLREQMMSRMFTMYIFIPTNYKRNLRFLQMCTGVQSSRRILWTSESIEQTHFGVSRD